MACSNYQQSTDGFAASLLHHSMTANPNASVVISPISIAVLLAMLHGGARPNSKTSKELSKALTSSKKTSAQCVALHYANTWRNLKMDPALKTGIGVYVDGDQSTLTDKYRKISALYGGTLRGLQFSKDSRSSANTINADVERQTDQKIKKIVDERSLKNARMVLISAAAFFAEWEFMFSTDLTFKKTFYPLNNGPAQQVETMHQTFDNISFYEDSKKGFKLIGLPYKNSKAIMYLMLPNSVNGINSMINRMRKNPSYSLSSLIPRLELSEVLVTLPKFTIKTELDVKPLLESMGVHAPFDRDEFNEMLNDADNVYVSSIRQKAYIEVNEVGTKAAAATGITLGDRSLHSETFKADHPFAYFLTINVASGPKVVFSGVVASINSEENLSQNECKTSEMN